MISPGGSCSSPSTSQQPSKSRGRAARGDQGARLTFLRLEEAVLTQLGQERTAGTGGLEVAQGNVRRVEAIRQMGKACRKWETEEGNMFQPKQPWNEPRGSTDCCGCRSLACQERRLQGRVWHRTQPAAGSPFEVPDCGSPSSPLAPPRGSHFAAGGLQMEGASF